jgi:hypothetical protein
MSKELHFWDSIRTRKVEESHSLAVVSLHRDRESPEPQIAEAWVLVTYVRSSKTPDAVVHRASVLVFARFLFTILQHLACSCT